MYIKYNYTKEPSEAEKFIQILSKYPVIALDIEATSLDPFEAKPLLLQISSPYKCYIFDLRYLNYELFRNLLESDQLKLFQNVKYDYKILKQCCGLNLNNIYDTMLAEQLLHLGLYTRASLEYLALKYLNIKMEKAIRSSFIDFRGDFSEKQLEYAARDALVLFDIYNLQCPKLEEYDLVHVSNLEFEFVKPLAHIELNGMKLDSEKWLKISKEYEKRCNEVAEKLADKLGRFVPQQTLFGASPINLDSPDQLLKVLRLMGYNLNNTSKKSLSEYSNDPLIKEILGYREYSKAVTTYGEIFLKNIKDKTGRIHSDFRQLVATGRVSCSSDYGAGLQQIKKDSDFRSCFIAEDGYDIITSDYSQMELRILADYSNDSTFIEAFKHNEDIHAKTASVVFKVPIDLVLKDDDLDDHDPSKVGYRYKAKAINFGLCLSGDSNVITDRGIIPIKEVKIGDVIANDLGHNKVIDFKCTGIKKIVKLILQYGYSLELTEDHIVKVIDGNGKYVDKRVADLSSLDKVCIKLGSDLFPDKEFVFFSDYVIGKRTNYKHMNLPKTVDIRFAAFLGLFVAEGSLIKKKKTSAYYSSVVFGFSNKNSEFIDCTKKLFSGLFGKRCFITEYDTVVKLSIHSVRFANWLADVCGLDSKLNKTCSVKIPECIKRSPKKVQQEFVKWLFEGDGTIKCNGNNYKIEYSSKSRKLVEDLQLLLLNFGILSTITYDSRKDYPTERYYVLSILANFNDLFMANFGFVSSLKNSKAKNSAKYQCSSYFIGSYVDKLEHIIKNFKVSKQLKDRFYKARYADEIGNIYLSELSKYDKFFKFIFENNIVPLPIVELKSCGLKEVYDISVDEHPYYLANGVVVHNCYGLTEFGLSSRLGCTKEQARQIIEDYFAGCPGIKKFLEDTARKAVENKYVESISGRKRFFRLPPKESDEYEFEKNSVERKAKNMPIQGCLEGNTLVRGYGRISSLVGKRLTDLETGFGANSGIGVYSGRRRLYKVVLSNGIELSITDSHKIPVVTNAGKLVDKTIFEIDIENDFLMVPISVVKGLCSTITKSAAYEVGFKFRKDVRLPNWVFAELLETRCIILDCLFESDFKFSSISYELISNIQQLLLTVGINSCITVDAGGYRVQVYEKFKDRFIQLVRSKDYSNVEFNDFDFCSIKSISDKPIEADAYDIICDKDPHYYIANGVIVHNSNADIIKHAIIDLDKNLKSYDAKVIHTVHDEVVVESNKKDTEEVKYIIDRVLTDAFKKYFHKVPIKTDTVVRPYWSKK